MLHRLLRLLLEYIRSFTFQTANVQTQTATQETTEVATSTTATSSSASTTSSSVPSASSLSSAASSPSPVSILSEMSKLILDNSAAASAASLIALVAGWTAESLAVTAGGKALSFDSVSGSPVEVLQALADKKSAQLFGASENETKQIGDWIGILLSTPADAALLARLNTHLTVSSFLAPNSWKPSAADYVAYSVIQEIAKKSAVDYPSLSRWLRFIVASIPRNSATTAFKVQIIEVAPPALSRVAEIDLVAARAAAEKLRTAAPAPAAKKDAAAPAAAAPAKDEMKKDVVAPAAGKADAKKDAKAAAGAATPAAVAGDTKAAKPAKEKAAKPAAAASSSSSSSADSVPQVYRVDFRVGKILSCAAHPTESRLFVEQVDVGEATGPRTVVSGLAEHYKPDELVGRMVVCIVNLDAGDIKGVVSNGRLMVATGADGKKEIAEVPASAKVGESITFSSVPKEKTPDQPKLAAKRFHDILKKLHTSEQKTVQYDGVDFMTTAGPVTVPTVAKGTVA